MPKELSTHLCNCFTSPDTLNDDPLCYFCTVGCPSLCASMICPGLVWFYLMSSTGGIPRTICYCSCCDNPRCNEGKETYDKVPKHMMWCCHWFLFLPFFSTVVSVMSYTPIVSTLMADIMVVDAFYRKDCCDPVTCLKRQPFILNLYYAQLMRHHYSGGRAAWSPFMAGSQSSSGGPIPSRDQIISKKIEEFTDADIHFFRQKVCWQLREKLTPARISKAFDIFRVHSTVISFLPPVERDSQQVRDAAEKLVEPFAKWRYHCSAIMC